MTYFVKLITDGHIIKADTVETSGGIDAVFNMLHKAYPDTQLFFVWNTSYWAVRERREDRLVVVEPEPSTMNIDLYLV